MATSGATTETYMSQWLKTATNGNVDCVFALLTNRMKLECNKCDMTLTVPIPDDPTVVDYSVSKFVKIHSHQGGHTRFEPHSIDKKAQELAQKMAEITAGARAFHGSDGVGGVIVDGKKIYWVKDEKGNVVGVSDHPPLVPVPVKAKDNPLEQKGRKFR